MTISSHAQALDRCPDKPWASVWCCAALVFLGLTVSLEWVWRSHGHQPSVADGARLWSWTRNRVSRDPAQSVVVLGDSRIQLGFDVPTARQQLNRPVVQLAIAAGWSPLVALEELASDQMFHGQVIAGVFPGWFESPAALLHEQYLAYHRGNLAVFDGFEAWVGAEIGSRLVIKRSSCNLRTTVSSILHRRFLAPVPETMDVDRQIHADFSKVDLPKLRKKGLKAMLAIRSEQPMELVSSTWHAVVNRYRVAAQQIQQRGGKVTFVCMPRSELEETIYPRVQFWDVFAQAVTPVAQTIHFEDYDDLRTFECPDMSHLDTKDVSRFTQSLLNHIR